MSKENKKGRPRLSAHEKSVVVSVRLPKSWAAALDKLATSEHPVQELIRSALQQFLQRKKVLRRTHE